MDIALIIFASAIAVLVLAVAVGIIATTFAKIRQLGRVTKELEENMPIPSAAFAERVRRDVERHLGGNEKRGEKA